MKILKILSIFTLTLLMGCAVDRRPASEQQEAEQETDMYRGDAFIREGAP